MKVLNEPKVRRKAGVDGEGVDQATDDQTPSTHPGGNSYGGYRRGTRAQPHAGAHAQEGASARRPTGGQARTHVREEGLSIEELIEQAAKLSRVQSKQLLDQLALRSKMTDKQVYNRDLEMWAAAVHAELNARLSTDESYGLMLVRKALGERECWAPVERFMKASKFSERTSAERRSLYMLLAELIVDFAKHESRKLAHGLRLANVARACPDIFSIFDYSFPDYLVNGLAYIVADQRLKLAGGLTGT